MLAKLDDALISEDTNEKINAERFCLGLASLKRDEIRSVFFGKIIVPRLKDSINSKFISELISCDPFFLDQMSKSQKLQVDAILLSHGKEVGIDKNTTNLQSPSTVASRILSLYGEAGLNMLPDFEAWIISKVPLAPSFIRSLGSTATMKSQMAGRYISVAGSSTFDTANRFAKRLSDLEEVFVKTFDDEFAFKIIASVVKAANTGAFSAIELVDNNFSSCPGLQSAAMNYSKNKLPQARRILSKNNIVMKMSEFRKSYLQ